MEPSRVRSSFYERVADAATAHAPQKEAVAVAVAGRGEGGNKDGAVRLYRPNVQSGG